MGKKKSPDANVRYPGIVSQKGYVHTEEELFKLLTDPHNPLITIKFANYHLSLYKYKDFIKLKYDINVIH